MISGDPPRRVLIAGAGEAGALLSDEIRKQASSAIEVVGFIDDNKLGASIDTVRVLGTVDHLSQVLAAQRVDEVIVAMQTAPGSVIRRIVETCQRANIRTRVLPGMTELFDGAVRVNRLRAVEIGDLYRRAPVAPLVDGDRYLVNRTVLITGAGGSIGFELCRHVAQAKAATILLLGHGEHSIYLAERQLRESFPHTRLIAVIADIRDRDRLQAIFDGYRPAVVFHAAAHKHVPLMEASPEEAVTNNVVGTALVVEMALRFGANRFVLVSTDKAVSPTSVMGASKRVAELIVCQAARRHRTAFMAVRFGNVLGSRGSVSLEFARQIEQGGPVRITHPDMRRFFISISETVHLLLQAGGIGAGGEVLGFDMGEPVRIIDLARDLIRLSGFDPATFPILTTGVRAGEKMSERLWQDGATVERTAHSAIWRVVDPAEKDLSSLDTAVFRLRDAAARSDSDAIRVILGQILPSYTPSATSSRVPVIG